MAGWPAQEAKARFSEILQAALTKGPQLVTLRDVEAAVLVSVQEWNRLDARARPSLKDFLLASQGRGKIPVPPRGSWTHRPPQDFGEEDWTRCARSKERRA